MSDQPVEYGAPTSRSFEGIEGNLPLFIGLTGLVVSIGVALFVVFTWFMFLDNVVHNRAEISRPWSVPMRRAL